MTSIPNPEIELTAEDAAKRRLLNRIAVGALLIVGLIAVLVMFNAVYTPSHSLPTKPSITPPARPVAEDVMPGRGVAVNSAGQHVLRLGVFNDVAKAEELRAKLESHGIPSTISVEARVDVGPYSTPEGVDAARAKLNELGLDGGSPPNLKK